MFGKRGPDGTGYPLWLRPTSLSYGGQGYHPAFFAIKAAGILSCHHFDLKSAYIHENYKYKKPVYVKQHPRFNGQFKHKGTGDQLIKNSYGTPPGVIFAKKGRKHSCAVTVTKNRQDSCLFSKLHSPKYVTFITLSPDDFLVVALHTSHIDTLTRRYQTSTK